MRVVTGFLRKSGTASLNVPPSGQSVPVKGQRYTWDGDYVKGVITRMKLGDVFYFGWTARYAKYREAYDGFLESAVQKWQTYVDSAVSY